MWKEWMLGLEYSQDLFQEYIIMKDTKKVISFNNLKETKAFNDIYYCVE